MKYLELNNRVAQRSLGGTGFYMLESDLLAIKDYEQGLEESNTMKYTKEESSEVARIEELVKEGFYEDVFELYAKGEVEEVVKLVYSKDFKHQSFMAVSKFYQSYAMKSNDKKEILERYEDRIVSCALYVGQGNVDLAKSYATSMINQEFQPATPTFLNAGKKQRGELVSCFLLEMDDSLNSINYVISTAGQLSKIGGGVAVNVSKLRARGEEIQGVEGSASGVVPVLKLLEDTFSYVNQLGQRNGAGVAYLNIFHKDVIEFLDTKKINASEKARLQTLSIALTIPDKFFHIAKTGEDFYVFGPRSVYTEYGVHLDDMDLNEMYDALVNNPNIKKEKLDARKILTQIAKVQFESGYPYLFFKDTSNRLNPLKDIGQIKMSNLCVEIHQIQETSTINDYGIDDEIRKDVLCNLGSLNIVNVMENKSIKGSVSTAMKFLSGVSDLINIANAPGVNKANKELHAVGLGALNLHGYLAKNLIGYESEEAKDFANVFFSMVNYYSLLESSNIAKSRGCSFDNFKKSEYFKGTYFDKYIKESHSPKTDKVKSLFDGIYIPTKADWDELKGIVQENGLYNAYRLAIAPTQSIGYIQNATPSVLPITDMIERRTYGDSTTYYPMPYLSEKTALAYKSAYNMDMKKVLNLLGVIQSHTDQGLSPTLFIDSNTSTKDLVGLYLHAYSVGLKAVYYTRTKNLEFEECTSCSI